MKKDHKWTMILFHQSYLLIIPRGFWITPWERELLVTRWPSVLASSLPTAKTSQHKTAFDPPLRKQQFHMNSPLTNWHTLKFSTTLIHQQQLYIYFITSFLSFRALINTTSSLPSLLSKRGEDNDYILRYFRQYNFFFFPTSGKWNISFYT